MLSGSDDEKADEELNFVKNLTQEQKIELIKTIELAEGRDKKKKKSRHSDKHGKHKRRHKHKKKVYILESFFVVECF